MTPEKVQGNLGIYRDCLERMGVQAERMNPERTFKSMSEAELLRHALHLVESVEKLVAENAALDKIGRHYAFLQACLSFAGWYTLEELMSQNRSD